MNLKKSFEEFCKENQFEINKNQIQIIDKLDNFYKKNFKKSFFKKIINNKNNYLGIYLVGDVGVGKTMILDYFFDSLEEKKIRFHFNEFMIKFHDFIFQNKKKGKEDGLENFVKNLNNKTKIIYFDEFQVTNIVDAMILGKLFKKIFSEKINVLFSSNINIDELYKNGLQRDQFIPFLMILKKNCEEIELKIDEDYRTSKNNKLDRFLYPVNQSSNFKFNKFFRKATKDKKKNIKIFEIKGRKLIIENYYDRVAKFSFDELCNRNLGSEDYIKIADHCDLIFIENLPNFNENNSNQQQRFITLIDIIYEKKIPLMIKSEVNLNLIQSAKSMNNQFKRTISRLYELTSKDYN